MASCNEYFDDVELMHSKTPDICVSPWHEPRVSVPQKACKWPNTLLGEAYLNIEQQNLDYLKQKHARKWHVFDNDDVSFFHSLLPHIARIPPEGKLLFQCNVQEMVQQSAYEIPQNYPSYTRTLIFKRKTLPKDVILRGIYVHVHSKRWMDGWMEKE